MVQDQRCVQPHGRTGARRFLITCWPFIGHIYPQMSIATALRARGHSVAFYTGENARALVENEGFTFFPLRKVAEERVYKLIRDFEIAAGDGRRAPRLVARTFREWLVNTVPGQVDDLQPIIAEWKPDALVTDLSMWGPILVLWETKRIPVALSSTFMGPLIPGPDAPPPGLGLPPPQSPRTRVQARAISLVADLLSTGMRRRVTQLRAQYDLPPLDCSINAFTGRLPLYLVPNVAALDYDRHDLPPSVHYVGPCVWNKPSQDPTPSWLDELPTELPWVHVTESTLRYADPFLLRAAAQGMANRPVELILTTGPQRDPNSLDIGPRASNVRVEQWVSHADLLPRCAVVVTTGGPATIMASLQVGVPLVVVPTTFDKPDNAQRVVQAGVGVRLAPRACTPDRLRAAVEAVLADPGYRERAQQMARRLAGAPGPLGAANLLEDLVATHRTGI